jgi:hypothetical protein
MPRPTSILRRRQQHRPLGSALDGQSPISLDLQPVPDLAVWPDYAHACVAGRAQAEVGGPQLAGGVTATDRHLAHRLLPPRASLIRAPRADGGTRAAGKIRGVLSMIAAAAAAGMDLTRTTV